VIAEATKLSSGAACCAQLSRSDSARSTSPTLAVQEILECFSRYSGGGTIRALVSPEAIDSFAGRLEFIALEDSTINADQVIIVRDRCDRQQITRVLDDGPVVLRDH